MPRYDVAVACRGLSEAEAATAVADVLAEFAERPWHRNVRCEWRDGVLRLSATNDFDADGAALLDEFSDTIAAFIDHAGEIAVVVESVVLL